MRNDLQETPTDEEMVEAINEMIEGVTERWSHETAGTIVANVLGAIVGMEHDTLKEALRFYDDLVGAGRGTLLDVLGKSEAASGGIGAWSG